MAGVCNILGHTLGTLFGGVLACINIDDVCDCFFPVGRCPCVAAFGGCNCGHGCFGVDGCIVGPWFQANAIAEANADAPPVS